MITRAEVDNLCLLSRIEMTDAEKDALANDLQRILGYVEQIRQIDLPDESLEDASIKSMSNNTRPDDEVYPPAEYTEILLDRVPDRDGRHIKVKKVIDAGSSA